MFGINKLKKEVGNDPQKGLDYAEEKLNKGFTGFVTKTFMGKDFVGGMNDMLAKGQSAIDLQRSGQDVARQGLAAVAEVLNVTDTGQMINYDPVVVLQLKVTPEVEAPFETYAQIIAPKIAVPRVGDRINIRYNPANKSQIALV